MRKAFTFLTSLLSSINKSSSKEAKVSTQSTSPDIQKKSQITTSNIKDVKNENLIKKKNNNDINPLNKIKKNISNDLKKPTLKKSPSELKKLESTRKTSSRTDSSTTVSTLKHSSSNHRKKLSIIKKSDDGNGESKNASENNIEDDDGDDNVPLGLRFQHSRSISYPSPRNQEYYDDDIQIRNISGMSLRRNRSTTKDPNIEKYHYHPPRNLPSPIPTTPPLIHTSRELYQPRPHHFRERRFSSSASSSSSASVDSNGSRYYRKYNANITPNNSQRHKRFSTPYWNEYNEYEYDDYNLYEYYYDEMNDGYDENRIINIPNDDLPIERMRRISLNTPSSRPRNDSFPRMYSGLTTIRRSNDSNRLVAGANPPPNKYQKEPTKRMSTSEYHKYQQEMVAAQYLKHGISPIIDDSIPVMMNISTRPKRLSVIDSYSGSSYSSPGSYASPVELARKNSCTRTVSDYGIDANNSGVNSHRRTHSESNVQIRSRFSTRKQHHYHHNTPLQLQHQYHHSSISSSSSGSTYISSSGSGGPPTPTSKRSSIMFSSNVYGSRPSTPSSVGSGYIFEKEKRRKNVSRE